jgi:hypothetical protein
MLKLIDQQVILPLISVLLMTLCLELSPLAFLLYLLLLSKLHQQYALLQSGGLVRLSPYQPLTNIWDLIYDSRNWQTIYNPVMAQLSWCWVPVQTLTLTSRDHPTSLAGDLIWDESDLPDRGVAVSQETAGVPGTTKVISGIKISAHWAFKLLGPKYKQKDN